MQDAPAPFYRQLEPLIKPRSNLQAALTQTSRGMFLEVRKPLKIVVPRPYRLQSGRIVFEKILWEAAPGTVLMPQLVKIGELWKEILGPSVGVRSPFFKHVVLIKDIFAAHRQWLRHVLDDLVTKRDVIRGEVITLPGEYDKLINLLKDLKSTSRNKPVTEETAAEIDRLFGNVRNHWKKQAREAFTRGDIRQAEVAIVKRTQEIISEAEHIFKRVHEIRRIIKRMEDGFEDAYLKMYHAIKSLREANPDLETIAEFIDKEIFHYLTWKVAAFEPFYGWGHSEEVMVLQLVPDYLRDGGIETAINLLTDAMASIEKVVKGVNPELKELRRVKARVKRRAD